MSSRGSGSNSKSRPTQQPANTEQKKLKKPVVQNEVTNKQQINSTEQNEQDKPAVKNELKTKQQIQNSELKKQNKQLAQKRKARQRWWATTGKKLVGGFIIVAILTGVIVGIVLGSSGKASNNSGNEGVSGTSKPILMDIGSTGCQPCQLLQPVLEELRVNYGNKVDIKFYDSWNTTAGANMATKYGVSTIPTLIFLDANGKEVARMTGYQSYDVIAAKFRSLGWI